MSEHRWIWTTRANLASRPGAHLPCMKGILDQLAHLGWDGRDLFGIELTLEESLTNAIRHGNCLDEAKQVLVECKASAERFWLRVRDEGTGFCPQKVPDCTAEANLERSGGRGLALIKAYMTHVEHNQRGNCVTMEKIRSPDDAAPPRCRPCETDDSSPE